MAIYHLNVKMISRQSGKSAVAAAAYRSRSNLYDERQGMNFDYTKNSDLAYSEIIIPDNAPEWMKDRSKLWNFVETSEKRVDAQLTRQIEVALPVELNLEQQKELIKEFIKNNYCIQGMVADLNIHSSDTNPHTHIMLTTREIENNGFGKKNRTWNDKENLLKWRESWAEHANRHLQLAGFDISIDHRSFVDQGLDLEPSRKVGLVNSDHHMSDDQVRDLDRVKINLEIAQRNGARIIQDPKIALDEISYHQALFSEKDIAKFAHRHSIDQNQFENVQQAILKSPELVNVGKDASGQYQYTTKTNLEAEKRMMLDALSMDTAAMHQVEEKYLKQAIKTRSMSTEQEKSFRYLVESGDISCMIGFAGAGKSYTLGAVREAYDAAGYQCKGMALSGIAAEGLEISSGIKSKTIHKTLLDIENKREQFTKKDVLIIDEAGMVATRQMQRIIGEARAAGAKVVFVGDPHQLQPIEAGGAFRGILDRVGYTEISEIRRQKINWQKQASKDFAQSQVGRALDAYNKNGHIKSFETFDAAKEDLIKAWSKHQLETKAQNKESTAIILAYRNKDIQDLNYRAREALLQTKALKTKGVEIETERGKRVFTDGDRVLFLRNEKSLGVKNGSIGTIEKIDRTGIQVKLDSDDRIAFDPHMYRDFDYGYAATVHKTQGLTVDRTFVMSTKHFDRHTAYVAMSRHREDVQLYYSTDDEGFRDLDHLKRIMSRDRPKELAVEYALNRGIEAPEDMIYLKTEDLAAPAWVVDPPALPTDKPESEAKKIEETLQKIAVEKPKPDLTAGQKKYITDMQKKGIQVDFVTDKQVTGTYKANVTIDKKPYACLDDGKTRSLVEYKKEFDNLSFQKVTFDGNELKKAHELKKEKVLGKNKGLTL